ncbi:thymidylate kinase-like isoform X1 [Gossypium australe]|uniref:Thymidylate kinase-like isoform X1 n=1 Tax=Gossypium australe TaxID=47621 RepID=A0A5B6UJT4_9ROSI|nr:thymidylate kinase-like isoform X1 [Gossypium australe]
MALTVSPFSLPYIHENPSNFHHKLRNPCLSSIKTHQIQSKSGLFPIFCTSKPSIKSLKTCKNCKTQFDPLLNHPRACHFHTAHFGGNHFFSALLQLVDLHVPHVRTFLFTGETKRKFESVYAGGTMDTPESGKVFQYWHCCGSEDPFDPGCTAAPHASYDD